MLEVFLNQMILMVIKVMDKFLLQMVKQIRYNNIFIYFREDQLQKIFLKTLIRIYQIVTYQDKNLKNEIYIKKIIFSKFN